jgi:hypothetical protein
MLNEWMNAGLDWLWVGAIPTFTGIIWGRNNGMCPEVDLKINFFTTSL